MIKSLIIFCIALLGLPIQAIDGVPEAIFAICKIEPQTTEEKILAVLIDSGFTIREQSIILAQSKHESGHYTNSISKKNNLFALHKRKNSRYALPGKIRAEGCTCFAAYRSVQEATMDYVQYRKETKVPFDLTPKEYIAYIKKKNYFEDDEMKYLRSIKKLIKKDSSIVHQFNSTYPSYRICGNLTNPAINLEVKIPSNRVTSLTNVSMK